MYLMIAIQPTDVLIPVLIFAGMGILFGAILAIAARVFAVKKDARVEQITEALPGANCGGCGFSGCAAFAEAVVRGEAPANGCRAGGAASAAKIGEILGMEVAAAEPMRAIVRCSGGGGNANLKYHYEGAVDCLAAERMGGGDKMCATGCMGLGTCVAACRYDALHIVNGQAAVDADKCTGCGACAAVCPKHLIELIPASAKYCVMCRSPEPGALTRKQCAAGCIGCKICEKQCPTGAITVNGCIAAIDYSKCTSCGACAAKCPRKIIRELK